MAEIKHNERYGAYMTSNNAPAPFVASSSQNSWGAFRAFSESLDDDLTLSGLGEGTEQWVQVQLDAAIRIWAFRISCRTTVSAKDAGQLPKNFKVQGSNDGVNFTDIIICDNCSWTEFTSWNPEINQYNWGDSKKIEVDAAEAFQYYRFSFGECQNISTQHNGLEMTPTPANTVKLTLIDLYQVTGEPDEPEIPTNIELQLYESFQLISESPCTWTSSDECVAYVTESGFVVGAYKGNAIIAAAYVDGTTKEFFVTVEYRSWQIEDITTQSLYRHADGYIEVLEGGETHYKDLGDITNMSQNATAIFEAFDARLGYAYRVGLCMKNRFRAFLISNSTPYENEEIILDFGELYIDTDDGKEVNAYRSCELSCTTDEYGNYLLINYWLGTDGQWGETYNSIKVERIDRWIGYVGLDVTPPIKTQYGPGETLDTSGMSVKLVFENGLEETVLAYTIDDIAYTPGSNAVTVRYADLEGTFYIIVALPCMVTFVDWNDSVLKVQQVEYGQGADAPEAPTREGYAFIGWDKDFSIITADKTVTAVYDPVATVVLEPESVSLAVGESSTIAVTLLPDTLTQTIVEWSVSDAEAVAFERDTKTVTALKIGTATIMATLVSQGVTASCSVTVTDNVQRIDILALPNKVKYLIGESLDLTGIEVTVTRASGKTEVVTGYTVTGFDSSSVGEKTITVEYENVVTTFIVTIIDAVVSIEITHLPITTVYLIGKELDLTGMTVMATWASEAVAEVVDYTVSGYDPERTGEQTVTVEFEGTVDTFTVFVKGITGIELVGNPNKTEYFTGEGFDAVGMQVVAHCTDGTDMDCTAGTIVDFSNQCILESPAAVGRFREYTADIPVAVNRAYIGRPTRKDVILTYNFQLKSCTVAGSGESDCISGALGDYKNIVTAMSIEGVSSICGGYLANFTVLDTVDITAPLEILPPEALRNCNKLKDVRLPDTLRTIGLSCFYSCVSFNEIVLPDGIEQIDNSAFSTSGIQRIVLSKNLKTIGSNAFGECGELHDITLNDGLEVVGYAVFNGCTKLRTLIFPDSVKEINSSIYNLSTLDYVKYPAGMPVISAPRGTNAKTIVIPEGVTDITSGAFSSFDRIEKVFLPNTLKSIENSSFGKCSSLKSISIPENVGIVRNGAFQDSGLEEIFFYGHDTVVESTASIPAKTIVYGYRGSSAEVYCQVFGNTFIPLDTYLVVFIDWDGTVLKEQTVTYWNSAQEPELPIREGYVFIGWDNDFSCIVEDVTVTAQFDLPATLTLSPSHLELVQGQDAKLEFILEPDGLIHKEVAWTSSHPEVTTFYPQTGLVLGTVPGTTVITVTHESQGVTASCEVTVRAYQGVTDVYKEAIKSNNRGIWDAEIIVDGIVIPREDIVKLKVNELEFKDSKLGIGSVVSSYAEITLRNRGVAFLNKSLSFKIGMRVGNGIEYVPFGKFYATDSEGGEDDETVEITAYDSIKKTEKAYVTSLKYPTPIAAVTIEIASQCGLEVSERIVFPDIQIASKIKAATCKDALAVLAQLMGCNVVADRQSRLDFRFFNMTDIEISADSRYYAFKRKDMDSYVRSVKIVNDNGTFVANGASESGKNGLDISIINPYGAQEITQQIMDKVSMCYRPGELSFLGDPSIRVGDIITVKDKNGKSFLYPIMENIIEYDGGVKNSTKAYSESEEEQEFTSSKKTDTERLDEIESSLEDLDETIYGTVDPDTGEATEGLINGLKCVSCTELPSAPDANTIYLIQGEVTVN